MKNILTRNIKGKLIALAIGVITYLGLQILSMTLLNRVYTFGWMADHLYCYTWIPALLLIVFDKTFLSYFVTFGSLAGTVIGEFVGSSIREQRMSQITSDMKVEEIHERSLHYGVLIWLVTIITFIAIGIMFSIFLNKRKKQAAA